MWTDNPVLDAERAQIDLRKPIGICDHCGRPVYSDDDIQWEDETGYWLQGEGIWLHEQCVMPYAREHWKENR